jgi:LytS/YehU family sensor histidine kinase
VTATREDQDDGDGFASPWLLGAAVALGIGLLRGAALVAVQDAFAHPMAIVTTMAVVSAVWLPVPAAVARVLRAGLESRTKWAVLGVFSLAISALEPLWFLGVLAYMAGLRPRGGYWINGPLRLDTNLLIFGAVVGWLSLREIGRARETAAARASLLRGRAGGAELDVLTMPLQPRFLFYTLNLVSQLAFESMPRARRAIANLRRLLEESVAPGRAATVSLGEELRFLGAYLDLQRDRFGARLDARDEADVDLLGARVPRMLLQPIVENAIRHGIAPRRSGGAVRVRARRAPGERLSIEVSDDGVGVAGAEIREGVGLANVRHRLEQLYPAATMIDLSERTGGGVTTRVEFPLVTQPNETASAAVEDGMVDDVLDETARDSGPALRLAVIVFGWALVAAIWTELEAIVPMAMQRPVPWSELFANNFLNAAVWIALTPVTLWLADALAARRRGGRIMAHALGALAFTAAHLAATSVLMRAILHVNDAAVRAFQNSWAVWDLVAYAVLVTIGESIAARTKLRDERVEAARAAGRLAAARVALLRLHLQPSMLLSAVDAVDAAIGDPVRCETTITRLGDVLRGLLATSGNERTTLGAELNLLESYACVVGPGVTVTVHDGVDLDAAMPAVILAPLLASVKAVSVAVDVRVRGGRLALELVIDGEVSSDSEVLPRTERRLEAMYGDDHTVRFTRSDAGAGILLEVPYRPEPAKASPMRIPDRQAIA